MSGNAHQNDATKLKATATLAPGGIVEVRDPTITTRKLAVDAAGKIGVSSLPNVTIGAAIPAGANAIGKLAANSGVDIGDVTLTAGANIIGSVKLTDGIHTADVDDTNRLLVRESVSADIYSRLVEIADAFVSTPLVTQVDKADVDGWLIVPGASLKTYWMTITNIGVNATEFKLWDMMTENTLFHLKVNPGETLFFHWQKHLMDYLSPIWYDYIAGADPAMSFTIGYWVA